MMQHLLLPVLAALIAGLAFTIVRWPGGLHMTFSQHVAANQLAKVYYALLFLVTLPWLLWFFVTWFVPTKNLPTSFSWFAAIAVVFQIICTWFPESGGWRTSTHRILTGISGVSMLPLVAIITTASSLERWVNALAWVVLCVMIILLAIALKNQKGYKWALLLQVGYYVAFFVVILAATYS